MKIEKDKLQHACVCFGATVLSFIGMRIFFPFLPSIISCTFLPIGLGLGKEYGDSKATGNAWSWEDIVADGVGILAFVVPALIIRLLTK